MTAEDVAKAIIAAAAIYHADPAAIAAGDNRRAGRSRSDYYGQARAQTLAAVALEAVFSAGNTVQSRRGIARALAVKPATVDVYFGTILSRHREGLLDWWLDGDFHTVCQALGAKERLVPFFVREGGVRSRPTLASIKTNLDPAPTARVLPTIRVAPARPAPPPPGGTTAMLMGDPPPDRSALAQRQAQEASRDPGEAFLRSPRKSISAAGSAPARPSDAEDEGDSGENPPEG